MCEQLKFTHTPGTHTCTESIIIAISLNHISNRTPVCGRIDWNLRCAATRIEDRPVQHVRNCNWDHHHHHRGAKTRADVANARNLRRTSLNARTRAPRQRMPAHRMTQYFVCPHKSQLAHFPNRASRWKFARSTMWATANTDICWLTWDNQFQQTLHA